MVLFRKSTRPLKGKIYLFWARGNSLYSAVKYSEKNQ
jgi:hypothetical protein